MAQARDGRAHSRQRRIEHRMVRMGTADGARVPAPSTGFAGIWTIQDSSGFRVVAAESRHVHSPCARQGRRRVSAHYWRQNRGRDCDAVCGGLSNAHPDPGGREWSRFRHRRFQSLQHSATRPTGLGGFERDDRILEWHVCNGVRGGDKGPAHSALQIRSGERWCFAADHRANAGDHSGPARCNQWRRSGSTSF